MALDRLPSIITDTEWTKDGFAMVDGELLVPAYVASQLGFSDLRAYVLAPFYERLKQEAHVLALCPFQACTEYIDFDRLGRLKTIDELTGFWQGFGDIVGPVNYETLMPRSMMMIALLDGGHALDDGVSTEIGHYASTYRHRKPRIAVRSDLRIAENIVAPINIAVRYFLEQGPHANNGHYFEGPGAYDRAIDFAGILAQGMIKARKC